MNLKVKQVFKQGAIPLIIVVLAALYGRAIVNAVTN
jgi:hypothetical protein